MSSLQDSLAKTLALQENKQGTMENAVSSSMKSSAWLGSFDLDSSSLKTLEIYSLTKTGQRSKKPSFKLPKQGTMQNGQLFQQVMWEPVIAGSEFGLLPTPRRGETSDLKSTPGNHFSLSAWARQGHWMLPTPTTRDYKDSGPNVNYQKAADKGRLPGSIVVQCSAQNGGATYLNPSFVEEMMGYPIGWTDLNN
jgi:hypothetical protein